MTGMIDKRRNKRFSCIVPVEGKKGSLFDQTRTVDLGKGGFGFIAPKKIPIGEKVAIEIDLADTETSVLATGKVKWVRAIAERDRFRVGISFEEVCKGSRTRFNKYLLKLGQEEFQ